jgi:pyruvyltransferase
MKYKVWWMCGEKVQNLGDVLTPKILDYFKISYEYSKDYNTICIGSIAGGAKDGCLVLGSGIAWENMKLNPKADWRFVRGPYTRKSVINSGGECPEIYGDPALLLQEIHKESNKVHDVGIIPHYKEYKMVKEKYPNEFVINLNNPNPLEVIDQITSCRKTISSSLHGIICSHAYEIPSAWVKFSDIIIGDDTKYKDHYSSIGLDCILSEIESPIFSSTKINIEHLKEIFNSL